MFRPRYKSFLLFHHREDKLKFLKGNVYRQLSIHCEEKYSTLSISKFSANDRASNGDDFIKYAKSIIIETENFRRTFSNSSTTGNFSIEKDEFTRTFLKNRIEVTNFQRKLLAVGSSFGSLIDPHRHDLIACLGETTGETALNGLLDLLKRNEEGKHILADKPRINTKTVDIEKLKKLPENTLGRAYAKFLEDNNVTPDSRMSVKFLEDPELAYTMTRYRECHDLIHTILNMPTNMLGEVTVKWVEAYNLELPMCYGGAIFGALRLRPKQRKLYKEKYLPWALSKGKKIKPLILVYWEKRWEQDITDLRNELNIELLS